MQDLGANCSWAAMHVDERFEQLLSQSPYFADGVTLIIVVLSECLKYYALTVSHRHHLGVGNKSLTSRVMISNEVQEGVSSIVPLRRSIA